MLIAFGEVYRQSAHNVKEVNIVVFRGGENYAPSISEARIKYALDFASHFFVD